MVLFILIEFILIIMVCIFTKCKKSDPAIVCLVFTIVTALFQLVFINLNTLNLILNLVIVILAVFLVIAISVEEKDKHGEV